MNLFGSVAGEYRAENSSKKKVKRPFKTSFTVMASIVGMLAIVLAVISLVTNMQLPDILMWLEKYFGTGFILLYTALVSLSCLAIIKVYRQINTVFWFQVGVQAANGISTLALTFTLLGISLGIGALSEQSLSPENVDDVISTLTAQFSMAFMTSVLGLPSAAIVRALLSVIASRAPI